MWGELLDNILVWSNDFERNLNLWHVIFIMDYHMNWCLGYFHRMDTEDYDRKIEEVLQQGPHTELQKDPNKSTENKFYKTLDIHKLEFPNNCIRFSLTPHCSKPSHLHGLPKIHKPEISLRPLLASSRNSPCHQLAKFLLRVLKPAGYMESLRKHFVDKMKNLRHFSFTSLFHQCTHKKTPNVIEKLTHKQQNEYLQYKNERRWNNSQFS